MNWFIPATLCAVIFGVLGLYVRYLHLRNISDPSVILFSYFAFALPVLAIPLLKEGLSAPQAGFWPIALAAAIGNCGGFYANIKSLEHSEASLVMPVLAVSPVFVIPVSAVLLKEFPTGPAAGAMALTVAGCYILTAGENLAAPFKKIKSETGVRWAFLTVGLWAFVANFDKLALEKSSAASYPFYVCALITLITLPFFLRRISSVKKSDIKYLTGCGLLNAALFMTHMAALQLTKVSYLIAVKRSGVLIAVAGGILLFKEKERLRRLAAAGVIIAGNGLLYLFS
jgi:drug/metabolite transporter (DMT)-like permease